MRIASERLSKIYEDFARSYGADDEEAAIFSRCLLRADLRGHQTQGIGLLPYVSELFDAGTMHFGRPMEIVRETAATALIDGHRGVGQIVATRAMDIAIGKARDTGIGFVTIRRSGDYAMAANYALQASDQGMIGISMSTGPILVAPWGGRDARFCTNPIALAVPTGDCDPIVIDMATSANSMGAVVLAARDGKLLAGLDVVDADGGYTNDPRRVILNAMDRESRMTGALLPAGPKGFGMLLLVEVLSALLSGERTWEDEQADATRGRAAFYGQTHIAISIGHFQDPGLFAASADRMIRELTGSRPAQGFDEVRMPGGGAAARERDYRQNGILIRDEEWRMVERMAAQRGIDASLSADGP
jgi:LDH2 family malate/lactate/ureidoglycolate dehydrogenase